MNWLRRLLAWALQPDPVRPPTRDPQQDQIVRALRYWQQKKLALDAFRPDFTDDQLRELNAAESRLLSIDLEADPPARLPEAEQ